MEPEPERRVVRAPGSRAPRQFSGERLRQRGKNIERLEPRYAAETEGKYSIVPLGGRDATQSITFFRLNPFAAFLRIVAEVGRGRPLWAPLPVAPGRWAWRMWAPTQVRGNVWF